MKLLQALQPVKPMPKPLAPTGGHSASPTPQQPAQEPPSPQGYEVPGNVAQMRRQAGFKFQLDQEGFRVDGVDFLLADCSVTQAGDGSFGIAMTVKFA